MGKRELIQRNWHSDSADGTRSVPATLAGPPYCAHCKQPAPNTESLLRESGLDPELYLDQVFHEPVGCEECDGAGFLGRTAVAEMLDMSDRIRQMILERRPGAELKQAAREEGMTFLRDSALEKVFTGVTTLREINKVTFVEVA